MKRIYLAAPYSHPNPDVRLVRFEAANRAAAALIRRGYNVFSPISHSHSIARHMGNDNESAFWVAMDLDWLSLCQEVIVLTTLGWEESAGVACELGAARRAGMRIRYMDADCGRISNEA